MLEQTARFARDEGRTIHLSAQECYVLDRDGAPLPGFAAPGAGS